MKKIKLTCAHAVVKHLISQKILINGKNDEKHEWSTLFDNDTNCEKYSEEDVSFHYTYNDGVIYVYCNTQFFRKYNQ